MSSRPAVVRPPRPQPTASNGPAPSASPFGPPPPAPGFWARWWSRPFNRIRVFASLGGLALLLLYALFMDLAGR
jgi:hypothetical protein